MNKVAIVTMREYLKNIRKISFWVATLMFPVLIIATSAISAFSSKAVDDKLKNDAKDAKSILIVDKASIINTKLLEFPITLASDSLLAIDKVKKKEADATIVIPENIAESKEIEIYTQSKGILSKQRYNDLATDLIKQSILQSVNNDSRISLFNAPITVGVTTYKDGEEANESFEKLIVPGIAVAIYFILITLANNYLLMSVSEEKENRMIEVVLTTIESKYLILGKVLAQIGTVLTQLFVLIALAGIGLFFIRPKVPADLSQIQLSPITILMALFYIIVGFLIIGNVMVGVGAAMPTYKEASSFSAIFIMLAIMPIYFFTIIIADPSGGVAKATSYFPLTAPMILLFRFALGELSLFEAIWTSMLILGYAGITYWLAVKLFDFGALQYNSKMTMKGFFQALRR